jgi:hypothetical protein
MDSRPNARRFRFNLWGIAAAILFVGDFLLTAYNFSLWDSGHPPLWSTTTNYKQALVANLASGVCAFMAQRRGHWSWWFLVLLSAWGALVNFLGDL